MDYFTDVPGSPVPRIVNVPGGFNEQTQDLAKKKVKSSFYDPRTESTTLVFYSGESEIWTDEEVEFISFIRKEWAEFDERGLSEEDRMRRENKISHYGIRLDAIRKVKQVHSSAGENKKDFGRLASTKPVLIAPTPPISKIEEILALDTVSFQLWADEASVDELESLTLWKKPQNLFQRILSFLRNLGLS